MRWGLGRRAASLGRAQSQARGKGELLLKQKKRGLPLKHAALGPAARPSCAPSPLCSAVARPLLAAPSPSQLCSPLGAAVDARALALWERAWYMLHWLCMWELCWAAEPGGVTMDDNGGVTMQIMET